MSCNGHPEIKSSAVDRIEAQKPIAPSHAIASVLTQCVETVAGIPRINRTTPRIASGLGTTGFGLQSTIIAYAKAIDWVMKVGQAMAHMNQKRSLSTCVKAIDYRGQK